VVWGSELRERRERKVKAVEEEKSVLRGEQDHGSEQRERVVGFGVIIARELEVQWLEVAFEQCAAEVLDGSRDRGGTFVSRRGEKDGKSVEESDGRGCRLLGSMGPPYVQQILEAGAACEQRGEKRFRGNPLELCPQFVESCNV
jgi:hypothetical protein